MDCIDVLLQVHAVMHCRYKSYFLDYLDISASLAVPPRSTFILVRAVKDVEFQTSDGKRHLLRQGQQDYVKRTEVEQLVEQGYLMHVVMDSLTG
jgi:hypothetical protein